MSAPGYLDKLFSLDGRAAVVTGAARGNGRALAEALLGAGASVLLVDVLGSDLDRTVAELSGRGLCAQALQQDLTAAGAAQRVRQGVLDAFGRADILVNNAGITRGAPSLEYTDEAWDATYRLNLRAAFELSRELGCVMRDAGGGCIVNVTSLNAEMAFPDNPAYVAFKGALKQLSKALALDLGRFNIRVNCIGPGYVHTDMTRRSFADPAMHEQRRSHTALGRWGVPEDLAAAVVFLASPGAAYVTGIDLYVDGGWLVKGL